MTTQSEIKGSIKVAGIPDSACFTTFAELLRSLETFLTVIIPNQTFSNVVISNVQPGQADRDKIWWRLSNSGTFIGLYGYANGQWSQVFPTPNQIFWLSDPTGTTTVPPGYKFLEATDGIFTAPDYATLMGNAIPAGIVGPYKYFPAIWVGL